MNIDWQPESINSPSDISPMPAKGTFYERFRQRTFSVWKLVSVFTVLLCTLILVSAFLWSAPKDFPVGVSVTVKQGMTAGQIALLLVEADAIRSPFWFKVWSVLLGGNTGIRAGEYYFSKPLSVIEMARRLTAGLQNLEALRVTIPEGLSNSEIAGILSRSLKRFDRDRFLSLARKKEGYLFPDTYTFFPNTTEEDIVAEMEENFKRRLAPFEKEIAEFPPTQADVRPLHAVLTMASLIEGEARTSDTRKQIAGILWQRLELGMPLQVDAVFPYILGKNTYEVTTEDLRVDSPYNTYIHAGLPPGPINNPSLDAITAALNPAPSQYLYYLSDKDGIMHYAVTHEQHLINRARYLGK